MLYLDIPTLEKKLMTIPEVSLSDRREMRKNHQEIFDNRLISCSSMDEIKDVSVDSVLEILENLDGYCGNGFVDNQEVGEIGEKLWNASHEHKIVRVM